MAGYLADELKMVHRWLQANCTAERRGDWTLLAGPTLTTPPG